MLRRLGMLSGGMAIGQVGDAVGLADLDQAVRSPRFRHLRGLYRNVRAARDRLSLRYEFAIPLAPTERQAADMAALCLVAISFLCVVSVPVIWLGGDRLAQVTQMPGLAHILWLLPATMGMAGIAQFLNYWSVYRGTFRLNASSRIVQSVLQSVMQVVLGVLGAGPGGMVLGYAVAYGVRAANFLLRLPRRDWRLLRGARVTAMRKCAIEQWRYPVLSAPSGLLQNGYAAVAGGAARRSLRACGCRLVWPRPAPDWPASPSSWSGRQSGISWRDRHQQQGGFVQAVQAGELGLLRFWVSSLWRHYCWPDLPCSLLCLVKRGELPAKSPDYLVPLYLTRLVVTPVSQTLNAYGRQSQHLLTATLDTSLLATSFVIAWQFSLEPLTTVLMFSVGSSLAYLLYFWLAFNAARSLARLAVEVEAQQREPAIDRAPLSASPARRSGSTGLPQRLAVLRRRPVIRFGVAKLGSPWQRTGGGWRRVFPDRGTQLASAR